MSATLTRRALFGATGKVVAIAALAGLPTLATAQPSREAWDAAASRWKAAEAAQQAYDKGVLQPADAKLSARLITVPTRFTMPIGYAGDAEQTKPLVWNDKTIRSFAAPEYANSAAPICIFAREKMPEIERITAHNKAAWIELDYQRMQDQFDDLVTVACRALDDMLATPAPHMAALAFKLQSLTDNRHLIGDDYADQDEDRERNPLPVLIADAERLARGTMV